MSNSYHPKGYGVSPALKRARQPFRTRNAITGSLLVGFAVSVWAYSISAVRQDDFDDVDAEALRLDKRNQISIEDQTMSKALSKSFGPTPTPTPEPQQPLTPDNPLSNHRTFLSHLRPTIVERFIPFQNPADGSFLVWGAPPVDKIGSISDRHTAPWKSG